MSATYPTNYFTPRAMIERGMRKAGLLGKGAVPKSEDYAEGLITLNQMAYLWQTQGIKLWLQQDYSITTPNLQQGSAFYSFGPGGAQTGIGGMVSVPIVMVKPTRLIEDACYFQDNTGNRRPLIPMSRNEYNTLSVVTQQGAVNSFYVDKQQLYVGVYLWLVPDLWTATYGQVHVILQNQLTGVAAITDTMNFPIEWGIALEWGFADEICTGQPQAIMDRCATRAQTYRMALEEWDVEDTSVYMQPDTRTQFQGNKFV